MRKHDRHTLSNGQGQGMNWIRREKRLAIYLRDGLACVYCGSSIEDGVKLTLDHIVPHSKRGNNKPTNLVTCCHKCNSSRGSRSWRKFVEGVVGYLNRGITGERIIRHVVNCRRRTIDVAAAKELIERRGSFTAALSR